MVDGVEVVIRDVKELVAGKAKVVGVKRHTALKSEISTNFFI